MDHTPEPAHVDPPEPDVDDVLQREPATPALPPVPVAIEGLADVRVLPNRRSSVEEFYPTTSLQRVLGEDMQRASVIMIGNVDWQYARTSSGSGVTIPAHLALPLTHADAIWARVASSADGDAIAVIAEYYT